MKNFKKLWAVAMMLVASFAMVSCGEDDPIVEVEEGLNVADGYYFTVQGEDPVAEKALLPEKIEGEGFAATDRDGFFGNYVFLTAGDYQLVKVVSKEISSTVGGTLGEPTDTTQSGYLVAKTTVDGSALTVASNGYYKVSFDETLSELIMMKVDQVSLIGNAIIPNGWGSDTELSIEGSASDEGLVYELTGLEMRAGEFKIRINNRWTIDRRIDRTATAFDPANGYVAFTNYGGTPADLVAGGGNMAFASADEGIYTVKVTLTNEGGASFESTKTGDVEEITFDPTENRWAVVGGATSLGWPANNDCGAADQDIDMTYDGVVSGAHTWSVTVDLAADEFKFRKNDCWDGDKGVAGFATIGGPDVANISGDNNFKCDVAGSYLITMTTADGGETYSVAFDLQ